MLSGLAALQCLNLMCLLAHLLMRLLKLGGLMMDDDTGDSY